ncbi:MAG: TldD/PmbA family protein [Planctomycetes bacterium]|jgi:TldD protein|nr:TldD/PmbA family protein [Planctomycetota bacterium]
MDDRLAFDGMDELTGALLRRIEEQGAHGVLRFEDVRSRSVSVEGLRVDAVDASAARGLGIQVFTPAGHCGFAAVDDPDLPRGLIAADRAVLFARAAERAGLEAMPAILSAPSTTGRAVPRVRSGFDAMRPGEIRDETLALAREVGEVAGGHSVRLSFFILRSDWRIVRSGGTDVSFRIPRSGLSVLFTARRDGEAVRTSAGATGTSFEVLRSPEERRRFLHRSALAADLAGRLLDAPAYPAGSYPILIDYALAKGLAHEAFGHAAESDGLDASILGRDGRFRHGETFGSANVTIIDESIEGDNAYQPFGGNGGERRRAVILERGVLREALADLHTAGRAGTPVTGAERQSSFAEVPIPRMSNIRMEVADAVPGPAGREFDDWTPESVRDLLRESGDLVDGGKVVFLSGYRGGQVNPALGDFVFHSTALYELTPEAVRLFRPGIFCGRIEAALHSIRRGYGPLRLDAAGTCGKAGQGVPSSGGSHHFVLLSENPAVRIGGRA